MRRTQLEGMRGPDPSGRLPGLLITTCLAVWLAGATAPAATVSPAEWLREQTPPRFKPGHTLPRLGQMHCVNPPSEVRAELAARWGFAVRLSRPHGEPELLNLCAQAPALYQPAAMVGNLANLENPQARAWPADTFLRKPDGSLVGGRGIFSPEMPDSAWQMVIDEAFRQVDGQLGGLAAERLVAIENWTEHGLAVPIHLAEAAGQDPKVLAAKGSRSWQEYVSLRKAYYETRLANALKRRYPNALHTAYTYAGFAGQTAGDWAWDYRAMKTSTDFPSPECYYNYYNTGFVGEKDMLSLRLFWRHLEIEEGAALYWGWLCAGYQRDIAAYQGDPAQGMYADLPRWMGFLKMSYLAGMIGGITTGEFGCEVPYTPFERDRPPRWLDQMTVLGHAHAVFTWVEPLLRQSQLLPGPAGHAWNRTQPAFEFPTGWPHARVLARKAARADVWLVGAWAADGVPRVVTIEVPGMGQHSMHARPEGTLHLIRQAGESRSVLWLDAAGMTPSLTASELDFGWSLEPGSNAANSSRAEIPEVAGLEVSALGNVFRPNPDQVMVAQTRADAGGNTSVRNTASTHLEWKQQGYYQRNRDLGQVFTAERSGRLDAIVLRTGPDTAAVLAGAAGAKVFLQLFGVTGTPRIHDNGTPTGTEARHGFSQNHRCDDYLDGVEYRPLFTATGGRFPELPPTRDSHGKPKGDRRGCLVYLRWRLPAEARMPLEAGKRYAFMVGFEEPGPERGFTLANANAAAINAPPSLQDPHDAYHGGWGLRREGNGTLPPTRFPGAEPPKDPQLMARLLQEALFPVAKNRFCLPPTSDGYPDVDTYRDLEFYLEIAAGAAN